MDTLEEEEYRKVYEYYKGLIAFRKAHAALRLTNAEDVKQNVAPVEGLPANVTAFSVNGGVNGEVSDGLFIIFNPNNQAEEIALPEAAWDVYVNGEQAGTEVLATITDGKATVDPISALVLVKAGDAPAAETGEEAAEAEETGEMPAETVEEKTSGNGAGVVIGLAAVAAAAGAGAYAVKKKKDRK